MKSKKTFLFVLALVLLVTSFSSHIGSTIVWIFKETAPVTNIFTYGKVDIKLTETDTQIDQDNNETTNTYLLDLQNRNIIKDAQISVEKDTENCWLFVKIETNEIFDEILTYEMNDAWIALANYQNVYYMEVEKQEVEQKFDVLKNQTVTLKEVSKNVLNELQTYPSLSVTGYAIQKEGIDTVIEAWSLLQEQASNN